MKTFEKKKEGEGVSIALSKVCMFQETIFTSPYLDSLQLKRKREKKDTEDIKT